MFTYILVIKQQSQETTVNKQDSRVYTANAVIRATLTELQEELVAVNVLQMIFHHTFVSLCQIHSPFLHIHTRLFLKYSNGEATYTQYIPRIFAEQFFSPLSWSQLPYSWLLTGIPVTGFFCISFSWLSSQYLGFNFSLFLFAFLKVPYIFYLHFLK